MGWGLWRRGRGGWFGFRGRRVEIVAVGVDGIANGFAPAVGVEGVDVFVLGEVNGLY